MNSPSNDLHLDADTIDRMVQQLEQIHGVATVAIDYSDGTIDAIHVLKSSDRRPKQIVRDVISTLRTAFDLTVDHKKVSVVDTGKDEGEGGGTRARVGPRPPAPGGRAAVHSISTRDYGFQAEVEVVLTYRGREALGMMTGGSSGERALRLLSQATAQALERFLDQRYRIDIGDVKQVFFGSQRAVLVTVSVAAGRDEYSLLGSCWVADDDRRAAVHATLDAINRVFGRLERRKHIDYEVGPTSSPSEVSEATGRIGR